MLVRRRCLSVEEEERGEGDGGGDGDGVGVGRAFVYAELGSGREGKEVGCCSCCREEICLCKRENLEREVQGTKTCRHEHNQNK